MHAHSRDPVGGQPQAVVGGIIQRDGSDITLGDVGCQGGRQRGKVAVVVCEDQRRELHGLICGLGDIILELIRC